MKREEKIRQAAESYAKGIAQDAVKEMYCRTDFIAGAEWADAHPHWISVEDGLPEVGVAVLTITPRGTQRVGFYEDGWWLANYIDLVRMGSITHWMPLPQPPKEGGEQ